MNFLFDINAVMLTVLNYPLSYAEFLGTLFGLLTVILAARANIWTWPTGIINELFFFIIFFQIQLYANMLLQVIFFITTLYGWYNWSKFSTSKSNLQITSLPFSYMAYIIIFILITSVILAIFIGQLHNLLPSYFTKPAAYPYADAIIMMISIMATLLLAQKKLQSWLLWIINDIICIALYFTQGIYFIAIEYIIFLMIACCGLYHWHKITKQPT